MANISDDRLRDRLKGGLLYLRRCGKNLPDVSAADLITSRQLKGWFVPAHIANKTSPALSDLYQAGTLWPFLRAQGYVSSNLPRRMNRTRDTLSSCMSLPLQTGSVGRDVVITDPSRGQVLAADWSWLSNTIPPSTNVPPCNMPPQG
jgi:hypothetical protein